MIRTLDKLKLYNKKITLLEKLFNLIYKLYNNKNKF